MSLEINKNPFTVSGVNAQALGAQNAKVGSIQPASEQIERVAVTQAKGNEDTKVAFGVGKYGDGSITSNNGYGLAFGTESTGIQGSSAGDCGRNLNLVA